jgi:hypothetical protein
MRSVLSLIALCVLSACSSLPAVDANTGAYDRQTSTGSNIPRHSTDPQSVSGDAVHDVMRFGPNGACTRGVAGCAGG